MSDRVEIARESFAAFERGDFDALAGLMHPDVEVRDWPEAADPRVYHGVEGLFLARDEWSEAWESMHAEPTGFVETTDKVFAFIRMVGKGRGSSIEMALDMFGVYTFRGSKVSRMQFFTDREAALEAAGVSEEQVREEAT
jgi:ketosteroid isomerase-like protein